MYECTISTGTRTPRHRYLFPLTTSDQKLTEHATYFGKLLGLFNCMSISTMSQALQDPDIQYFVNRETQKQRFQGIVHEMTARCWDTCMGNPGNKLDSKTEGCIRNCVERFLDTSNFVVNRLESTPAASPKKSTGFMLD